MFRLRLALAGAVLIGAAVAPGFAHAQYGGSGMGSALSADPMMHQGKVSAGIDDISTRAGKETPFKIIKDVKLGLKDADPNVRVQELKKLRNLADPEVNKILMDSMSDPDIRVKIKAVDLLGARQANEGVPPMSQLLFLRSSAHATQKWFAARWRNLPCECLCRPPSPGTRATGCDFHPDEHCSRPPQLTALYRVRFR